jgi:hypothetical protein
VYQTNGSLLFISQTTANLTADLQAGHHIGFTELSAEKLHQLAPEIVVCPLVSADFDAVIVLERLKSLGFAGQCLVLSAKLPQQALVLAELRRIAGPIVVRLIDSASL